MQSLALFQAGMLGGGATDGKGVSLVYYFALPDQFELEDVKNKAALGLMQRFIWDATEKNGWATFKKWLTQTECWFS